MTDDPIKLMEACLGSVIEGIEVDTVNLQVTFKLNKGVIVVSGSDLEMRVEVDDYNQ